MRAFGRHLGMAFQIVDDLLDYTSSTDVMGKPSGQDLLEHKVTLPLIAALPKMGEAGRAKVEDLFADPEPAPEAVDEIVRLVTEAGGVDETRSEARAAAGRAAEQLEGLPDGPCTEALRHTVDYVVERVR